MNLQTPMAVTRRLGVIGPLDLIDTSAYEFYRIAPPEVIMTLASIGLQKFSEEGAQEAFTANFDHRLRQLANRGVDVIMLNGTPLLLFLSPEQLKYFSERAAAIAPLGGYTGLDAAVAAFKALGIARPAIGNKWSDEMNRRLVAYLGAEGIEVENIASTSFEATEVTNDYADGSRLAISLAEEAMKDAPGADGLFLAGGAWLTLHLVEELEQRLQVPVVTGLLTTNWFALNILGTFEPRPNYGQLLLQSLDTTLLEDA